MLQLDRSKKFSAGERAVVGHEQFIQATRGFTARAQSPLYASWVYILPCRPGKNLAKNQSMLLRKIGSIFLILCGGAKIFWQDDGVDRCAHIPAATVSDDAQRRIFDHDSAVMVPFGISSASRQVHIHDLLPSGFFVPQDQRSEQCPATALSEFICQNMLMETLYKLSFIVLLNPNALMFGSE